MAKHLAKQKFNICIVARNEDKMKEKLKEIEAEAGHPIKTKYIVADFSKMHTIKEYEELVAKPLQGLDIAVLLLNAGVGLMGPFKLLTNLEVERIVNVNSLQVVFTAKVLLQHMAERSKQTGKRSAIMVTSSGLGARPMSGTIVYSATKSFASFLAEGLSFELENDHIDVMSYQAGEVCTKMLSRYTPDAKTIMPERAAEASFRDLGCTPMTRGSFRHEHSMFYMDVLPLRWIQTLFFTVGTKTLKKIRKKQEARGIKE